MAPAPWESVPCHEQFFALITGANSGVGLGLGQRLIDEFLHQRPLSHHLILLPTTRSARKSRETVLALRRHLEHTARNSESLCARSGGDESYAWPQTFRRVHILSPQLDLTDLTNVYDFAAALVRGTVSNPPDEDGMADNLTDVRIPRLDAVVFNAGFGGWDGLDWFGLAKMVVREGISQAATWPDFKLSTPGGVEGTEKAGSREQIDEPVLGEVFCANVFGHYLLGHALMPLLARADGDVMSPGKIIWTRYRDLGRLRKLKRLTDILALTCSLPSVLPASRNYFRLPGADAPVEECYRPRVYLTHPGVLATTLFPLPSWLFLVYRLALVFIRFIGSPWHTVDGYPSAAAHVTIALESQDALDESHAERVKWGSACSRLGRAASKKTEVQGWGWEGEADSRSIDEPGFLSKKVGRWAHATETTEEDRVAFEEMGAQCWAAMEKLRAEWEDRLGLGAVGSQDAEDEDEDDEDDYDNVDDASSDE
ncbi:unnamed protein product [Parascedosporium putredinis]|uniref:3-ketosteroid reductase n=1 Tax=Parascedosporium putredinis TaxID=1442378 RepID=A0A9P1ME90_9PEZI|nr:unnamed protein product [Parascedosporium putredinis]CAI8005142.1 unnamed protein product [Parascedosporium putredinis]